MMDHFTVLGNDPAIDVLFNGQVLPKANNFLHTAILLAEPIDHFLCNPDWRIIREELVWVLPLSGSQIDCECMQWDNRIQDLLHEIVFAFIPEFLL